MQRNYLTHLIRSQAETNLANSTVMSLNERKAAIIAAELNQYYPNESELLKDWDNHYEYKDENEVTEVKAMQLKFFLLKIEYEELQKVILAEKNAQKHKNRSRFLNRVIGMIGDLNLLSMTGAFTSNVLGLISILYNAITTAVVFAGSLVVLALSLPLSLATTILGVGIEFLNTLIHTKTPNRGKILAADFAILGFAVTALMIPFHIVPAVIIGFPVVLPLLFTGILAAFYYKDQERSNYTVEKIFINNQNIINNEALLNKHMQTLTRRNTKDIIEDPTVQHLSLLIAEQKKENALLEIQRQTLSTTIKTHAVSCVAMGVLLTSAFLFPPLSLAAAIAGVVGMGLFVGMQAYGKHLRNEEQHLLKMKEQELTIGALQMVEIEKAMKKIPKPSMEAKNSPKQAPEMTMLHPRRLFECSNRAVSRILSTVSTLSPRF